MMRKMFIQKYIIIVKVDGTKFKPMIPYIYKIIY